MPKLKLKEIWALDAYFIHRKEGRARRMCWVMTLEGGEPLVTESTKTKKTNDFFNRAEVADYLAAKFAEEGTGEDVSTVEAAPVRVKTYDETLADLEQKINDADNSGDMDTYSDLIKVKLQYQKASSSGDTKEDDRVRFYMPNRCKGDDNACVLYKLAEKYGFEGYRDGLGKEWREMKAVRKKNEALEEENKVLKADNVRLKNTINNI